MVRQWAISIRQPYVECIVAGVKAYEIRTRIPERLSVGDEVYVVQTGSGGEVVMSFVLEDIICDAPEKLWEKFMLSLCIQEKDFYLYAAGRTCIYLLKVGAKQVFGPHLMLSDLGLAYAPQWFTQLRIPHSAPSCI